MRYALVFLALLSLASAQFTLESVNVKIGDIEPDGSAHVHESIRFLVKGDYATSVYDSGFETASDLSAWQNNTNLNHVRQHVNPAVVNIENFRLQPQPRSSCNAFLETCRGELIFDYYIKPVYDNSSMVNGTGLFFVHNYKPRTTRYVLNPDALSFKKTSGGNIILEPNVKLAIELPADAKDMKVNPNPTSVTAGSDTLSWTDVVLVSFSLVFESEESIDKEVARFFSDALGNLQKTIQSQHGLAFLAMVAIMLGSYIYINISKKRKEG